MKIWNLQKDLKGHKQLAPTLSWKEHRKGFGDQMKKEETWHLHGRVKKKKKNVEDEQYTGQRAGEVLEGCDLQTCLGR